VERLVVDRKSGTRFIVLNSIWILKSGVMSAAFSVHCGRGSSAEKKVTDFGTTTNTRKPTFPSQQINIKNFLTTFYNSYKVLQVPRTLFVLLIHIYCLEIRFRRRYFGSRAGPISAAYFSYEKRGKKGVRLPSECLCAEI